MPLINPNADYEARAREKFFKILSSDFEEMYVVDNIVEELEGFLPCNLTDIMKLLLLILYKMEKSE